MLQEFNSIKKRFDTLNLNHEHFVNSNDICTPMDCVKEMLDSLPAEFWQRKNLKVLDSCCGNGNFHAYHRLWRRGHKREVKGRKMSAQIRNALNFFGYNLCNKGVCFVARV